MVLVAACAGSEPLELDVRHGDGGGHSARHSPHAAAGSNPSLPQQPSEPDCGLPESYEPVW